MSLTTSLAGEIPVSRFPAERADRRASVHDAAPTCHATDEIEADHAEQAFVESIESAMLGIVVAGASLFGIGLCHLFSGPVAERGAVVLAAAALASGAASAWCTLTSLVRFVRLTSR